MFDEPRGQHLSSSAIVARKDGLIEAEIDGEIVVLSVEHGSCYALNRVGSRIWELLAGPVRVEDICATLLTEYKVNPDVCERQVIDLLDDLHAEGLLTKLDAE